MSSSTVIDQVASLVTTAFHAGLQLASRPEETALVLNGLEQAQATAVQGVTQSPASKHTLQQFILDAHQVLAECDLHAAAPHASSPPKQRMAQKASTVDDMWERVQASVPAHLLPAKTSVDMMKQLKTHTGIARHPGAPGVPSIRRQAEIGNTIDELVQPFLLSEANRQSFACMHPADRVAVMKMLS
jgi:hypothetical protein